MTTAVQIPPDAKTFEHSSVIDTTLDDMIAFHNDPQAFSRLTPPPIIAQIHRRDLKSLTDGEMEFTLWMGPIPIRWLAQHEPGPTEHSFTDRMIQGPLAFWLHRHIFEAVEGGVRLTDRISIVHKPGVSGFLTRLMFDGLPLRVLFIYRHLRTRLTLGK
jgi:ligand-binding SRPBCC domain-containing protein